MQYNLLWIKVSARCINVNMIALCVEKKIEMLFAEKKSASLFLPHDLFNRLQLFTALLNKTEKDEFSLF